MEHTAVSSFTYLVFLQLEASKHADIPGNERRGRGRGGMMISL